MSLAALSGPGRVWLFEAVFLLYALVGFVRVLGYVIAQSRAHRLIDGPQSPPRFGPPGWPGWFFTLGVLLLLFAQSPLYLLLVVYGIAAFLLRNRRLPAEQFGLRRLSPGRILQWSLLVCGAVIFVELPLSELVDRAMNALRLPHPQQESVEFFRQASRPGQIFAFLLQAVFLSPVVEELFFRGFLFSFLKNYTSTTFALFLSAGVFAFAHANLGSALQLWVLGLVLGLAYEHSGCLLLSIGIHACWNLLTALTLLLEKGGM